MSDKQNLAEELINMWQKQLQDYFKDPKVTELMADQYAKYQQMLQAGFKDHSASASNDVPNDVNAELRKLEEHVAALEARIKLLERCLAKSK